MACCCSRHGGGNGSRGEGEVEDAPADRERANMRNKGVWMEWRCILLHLIFFRAEEERPGHDAIHPARTNVPTNTTKYCDDHRRARELSWEGTGMATQKCIHSFFSACTADVQRGRPRRRRLDIFGISKEYNEDTHGSEEGGAGAWNRWCIPVVDN